MRISDWSSDVCSSDLGLGRLAKRRADGLRGLRHLARVERVLRQRVPPAVEALGQGGDCRRDWAAQRGEAGGKGFQHTVGASRVVQVAESEVPRRLDRKSVV